MVPNRRKHIHNANQTPMPSDHTRTWLKIGEVSKQSGIGIEALRFYERSGLLDRPARTEGGYRLYDPAIVERLHFIKRAQFLGFSLDEIAQIIADKKHGQSPCKEVREIVRLRLSELDERMAQMRRYRKELASALSGWDEMGESQGDICGLIESTEIKPLISAPPKLRRKK